MIFHDFFDGYNDFFVHKLFYDFRKDLGKEFKIRG